MVFSQTAVVETPARMASFAYPPMAPTKSALYVYKPPAWTYRIHVTQIKTGMKIAFPLSLPLEVPGLRLGTVIDRCRLVSKTDFMISAGIRKNSPTGNIHPDGLTKKFVKARKISGVNLVITHRHFTRSVAWLVGCTKTNAARNSLKNYWATPQRTPRNSISMNAIIKLT